MRHVCVTFLIGALGSTMALPVTAQTRSESHESVCLGFSFGVWTPALDWRAAGHLVALDSARASAAPGAQGWAAPVDSTRTLILFPGWWPAGVTVNLSTRTPATGDTVFGRATALVANGGVQPPTSGVRAWRVPCRVAGQ